MTDAAFEDAFAPRRDLGAVFREWRRREPMLAGATIAALVACLPVLFAMGVDGRTVQDANVWVKPLKFLLSIASYFAALVWFAGWLPKGMTGRNWYRAYSALLVFCATAELSWIIGAAAWGTTSHFNDGTALMAAAYTMAGIMAVTLITASPVYAVAIARNRAAPVGPAMRDAAALGLALTFPLTFVIAGYLGGNGTHFVSGNLSDAEGMILTGWARDGGDLRVGHFFALHAIHFIPAFGLLAAAFPARAARPAVWAFAAGYAALTIFAFLQALGGEPFLPMIP